MIRISQVKLPVDHSKEELLLKAAKQLRIDAGEIKDMKIVRQSIDARKKPDLFYSYTLDLKLSQGREKQILKKNRNKNVSLAKNNIFQMPEMLENKPRYSPVIVGSGPAGLFCGWLLAKCGYAPIILERGEDVDHRREKVEKFWKQGLLDPECNVQFGEGGAGTFSDGKLNTSVKDPCGRNTKVLQLFVEAGAPEGILYQQKPHLGTDQLMHIVKNIRNQIIEMGGQVRFSSCLTDIEVKDDALQAVEVNHQEWIKTDRLVLALGHSARDTFHMLYEKGIVMEAKAFAAGVRIEHPQEVINESQYGVEHHDILGAAPYKLTHQTESGRGIYSFCMCPGGYVVNASSEEERLAVNGMSYSGRDSTNANSALIVTVRPQDFAQAGGEDCPEALKGIAFQRDLEHKAWKLANGKVPIQLWQDFREGISQNHPLTMQPCIKGAYEIANLRSILPKFMGDAIEEGIFAFGKKIKGFDRDDAIISGVESRSSSPVRILRNEKMQSNVEGIYPCGEGAGYAGGITSAAIDGLKTAQAIANEKYL